MEKNNMSNETLNLLQATIREASKKTNELGQDLRKLHNAVEEMRLLSEKDDIMRRSSRAKRSLAVEFKKPVKLSKMKFKPPIEASGFAVAGAKVRPEPVPETVRRLVAQNPNIGLNDVVERLKKSGRKTRLQHVATVLGNLTKSRVLVRDGKRRHYTYRLRGSAYQMAPKTAPAPAKNKPPAQKKKNLDDLVLEFVLNHPRCRAKTIHRELSRRTTLGTIRVVLSSLAEKKKITGDGVPKKWQVSPA